MKKFTAGVGGHIRETGTRCSVVVVVALHLACASYPANPPLTQVDRTHGYRFETVAPSGFEGDETLLFLSLSGGGYRAVALDYGMVRELDRIGIGEGRSLLDEVDVVLSVSAAALPAAYIGTFGPEVFLEKFREDVLLHPLQSRLTKKLFSPRQWFRLASSRFSRSDLAVELVDEMLEGRTFEDLRRQRPLVVLNATDVSVGARFPFLQSSFDLLCSDLDPVSLGRGVVASMAFTGGFPPLTLVNHREQGCGYRDPPWVDEAIRVADVDGDFRRYERARQVRSYGSPERPFVHLLDGGISDNLGLRAIQDLLFDTELMRQLDEAAEGGRLRRVVVLLVDARTSPSYHLDLEEKPPGLAASVSASASIPLRNFSTESAELLRSGFADAGQDDDRGVDLYFVHLRFELLPEGAERDRLLSIPTTLQLPEEDVDLLISAAPKMLAESAEFRRLLDDLEASWDPHRAD